MTFFFRFMGEALKDQFIRYLFSIIWIVYFIWTNYDIFAEIHEEMDTSNEKTYSFLIHPPLISFQLVEKRLTLTGLELI
jgi:hypothetical protein